MNPVTIFSTELYKSLILCRISLYSTQSKAYTRRRLVVNLQLCRPFGWACAFFKLPYNFRIFSNNVRTFFFQIFCKQKAFIWIFSSLKHFSLFCCQGFKLRLPLPAWQILGLPLCSGSLTRQIWGFSGSNIQVG
ncbi:hypothetical protein HOLleu_20755 [Holothuria leucospilota]|uniref:Uncharacterized protein n=1 Tax=Holothuria leucospilota TaxID=206669 RepID=A0A9Q1H8Q1_HOLLE|nr:hypothetical protein HOLleu_20755 [Holothuria leucospilota]